MFLSVLVVGEIRRGIENLRRKDPARAQVLDTWLGRVVASFDGRILPVTREIAETWGRLSAPDKLPVIDGLLAATAIAHNLILVTRNTPGARRAPPGSLSLPMQEKESCTRRGQNRSSVKQTR